MKLAYVVFENEKNFVVRKCKIQKKEVIQGMVVAQAGTLEGVRGMLHYKIPGLNLEKLLQKKVQKALSGHEPLETWTIQ